MSKIALILGASSEIGAALINEIKHEFDIIVAHYNTNRQELDELRTVIGKDKLHIIKADFSSKEDTNNFIKTIEETGLIPTHIVHLPAAAVRCINFHKSHWNCVQTDIDVSLRSIYKILNRFIRPMTKKGNAKIVFVLSSCTVNVPNYMLDYTVVKYSLLGLMKSLAVEYAEKGININAVSPSMVETKFLNNLPRIIIEKSRENSPLKRNANVQDIVPVIKFLLSEESSFITGQNIVVSGGNKV
ncbi:MAG: SDR family oxidoreductase [Defluviitaleaceae bacterium]|nr:SDR family oxidoreductase [Defluviitaleaceae bacterium]